MLMTFTKSSADIRMIGLSIHWSGQPNQSWKRTAPQWLSFSNVLFFSGSVSGSGCGSFRRSCTLSMPGQVFLSIRLMQHPHSAFSSSGRSAPPAEHLPAVVSGFSGQATKWLILSLFVSSVRSSPSVECLLFLLVILFLFSFKWLFTLCLRLFRGSLQFIPYALSFICFCLSCAILGGFSTLLFICLLCPFQDCLCPALLCLLLILLLFLPVFLVDLLQSVQSCHDALLWLLLCLLCPA